MFYSCKNCRRELTEFDLTFEKELKGDVSVDKCFCQDCNLKDQPMPLIKDSLTYRLKQVFQFSALWIYLFIVVGMMAVIAFGGDEWLWRFEEAGLDKGAVDWIRFFILLLFVPMSYFAYWNYRDMSAEIVAFDDFGDIGITLLLKHAYPIFVVCVLISYIFPDNDDILLLSILNKTYFLPFGVAALTSFVAFFCTWFKAGAGKFDTSSMTVVDTYYVSTYDNGTITTKKENVYSGDSGLFVAFTYPWWSIFYFIIKSIVISIQYLIHIHRFADKKVVRAYRESQKKCPKVRFFGMVSYKNKLLNREGKINKIKMKYAAYGDKAVEKATARVKEVPLPKEKIRGVLYYNIKSNIYYNVKGVHYDNYSNAIKAKGFSDDILTPTELVYATYKKDGKEINVTFIDGQRVYED